MPKIDREELIRQLEALQPGISQKAIVEQENCIVFKDGEAITFNDEVSCRLKTSLNGIKGAVRFSPLLGLLTKLQEKDLDIKQGEGELIIKGKNKEAGIRMDAEIVLPYENVDKPKKFKPLPEDFVEAVKLVQECAGKDESQFWITCLHIHPKYVEACDNYQITRYKLKTGLETAILVRRNSIKHISTLDMTEVCETETWIHFRNPSGLVLSCRRWVDEFPNLTDLLKVDGTPATLPKGLGEALEKAELFSAENADDNQVTVELRAGKLRVKGQGATGRYSEVKKMVYNGPPVSFLISPKLLSDITRRHNDCFISDKRLKVEGGKWTYVSCLGSIEKKEEKEDA